MSAMQSAFNCDLYEALTYLSAKGEEAEEAEMRMKMNTAKNKSRR